MAGTPGKNKIERGFRILWDDSGSTARDLTADLIPGTVSGGGKTLDEVEMTGVSNSIKSYLGGFASSQVSAQFYMDDTATTGAHTVTKDTVGLVGTLTLQYGTNGAAPDTGDPEWEGEYALLSAQVSQSGGKMIITCNWQPGTIVDPAWGTVA